MTTTPKTTTDPLGDWFRHIGTKLSDTDYEAGIKALSWARDQFHPTRTNPTATEHHELPNADAPTDADTGGISAEPSDAEVRAAAEAIARCTFPDKGWWELSPWKREYNTKRARAALLAARKAARHE